MRLQKRTNGYWFVETTRHKRISLRTKDESEAKDIFRHLFGGEYIEPPTNCQYCSKEIPSGRKKFCCKKCSECYHNEMRDFGSLKAEIFLAIGNKCCMCGTDQNVNIHHRDGKGRGVEPSKRNNDIENLIVFCSGCHTRLHILTRLESKLGTRFVAHKRKGSAKTAELPKEFMKRWNKAISKSKRPDKEADQK